MATKLVEVPTDSIRIGSPLPFAVRSEDGTLLAHKGYVISSREDLETILDRGVHFYVDAAELEGARRAYVSQLYELVREEQPLGRIAETGFDTLLAHTKRNTSEDDDDSDSPDWLDLQEQANLLLRDNHPATFLHRVESIVGRLFKYIRRNSDGALFALIYLSAGEVKRYSATHSLLVSAICCMAARDVLKWPAKEQVLICEAALTMNLGMTDLQDRLAQQAEPLSPLQRQQVDNHPQRSCDMLRQRGVTQADWLEAVLHHHTRVPGPLEGRSTGQRMARMIQRADMFAAQLAPRAGRQPTAPSTAMQATFFDENRKVDAAGSALIKAVGIYPPGTFVRLANNEIGVVVRRSANTTAPRVAVVIGRSGTPTAEHAMRDTSLAEFRVIASVPHRNIRVVINLAKFLPLTGFVPLSRLG